MINLPGHMFQIFSTGTMLLQIICSECNSCQLSLDETGTIIGKNLRGEDLYNKVNEILGVKNSTNPR